MPTEDLYTTKDVERIRKLLVCEQGGIDPILQVPFKEPPCLDHDHETQLVRGALGRNSNAFEGKVYNAFIRCLRWQTNLTFTEVLKNLVTYLEKDCEISAYHPAWIKKAKTKFNALSEKQKDKVLVDLGYEKGTNSKQRKDIFAKLVLDRKLGYDTIREAIQAAKEEL